MQDRKRPGEVHNRRLRPESYYSKKQGQICRVKLLNLLKKLTENFRGFSVSKSPFKARSCKGEPGYD
jgi:hypothetical protein